MTQTVNMPDGTPSRKVVAASTTAAVTAFVLWLLGEYVFPERAVPEAVEGLVLVVVPGVVAFVAGYVTKRSVGELTH
jgi:hypothetical protein